MRCDRMMRLNHTHERNENDMTRRRDELIEQHDQLMTRQSWLTKHPYTNGTEGEADRNNDLLEEIEAELDGLFHMDDYDMNTGR